MKMVKNKTKKVWMVIANILLTLGLLIVYGTHIVIISMGLPQTALTNHAILNIIAGVFISAYTVIRMIIKR